jgi:hypothetical protein
MGPRREVARGLILRRDVPLHRIGREPRSHDDALSEAERLDPGAELLDAAGDVRADDMRQRNRPANGP